jgi:uncharacterized hydrophobic protein (TIGR00271 family)
VIHIRAVSPADVTPAVVASLASRDGVLNLVVHEGVARNPVGDAIACDVMGAEANHVLADLRGFGLVERGSIVVEDMPGQLSDRARAAEAALPRGLRLAPVWEQVDARIRTGGRYPPSWFVLLIIASLIATVGILTNSQILIVGAMVVGPEYAAIIAVALAINERERDRIVAGTLAVFVGFGLAVVAAAVFGAVVRATGTAPDPFRAGVRPVSDLINTPNGYSVVVATLAGIVGVVSVVEARTGALIGVFISVTTIPAAADIGLSTAFGSYSEAGGSLIQLVLNLTILLAVGVIGLTTQHHLWRGIERRAYRKATAPASLDAGSGSR